MREKIEAVLNQVRPAMRMDGGDIEFVGFDEKTGAVRVRLHGACRGCPMSQITLKMAVEGALVDAVPEVKEVIAVEEETT
jgi:Fe-S cluster biogenesis protein NfuA